MAAIRLYSFLLILYCVTGCTTTHNARSASFYFWKTTVDIDTSWFNTATLNQLGVSHFYVRYFDVDWSENLGMPAPVAPIAWEHNDWFVTPFTNRQYTPVVFITTRAFEEMPDTWADTLAVKITAKIEEITTNLEEPRVPKPVYHPELPYDSFKAESQRIHEAFAASRADSVTEIQIDCDWTPAIKDKYFSFLRKMKEHNPNKTISATVRLYPYKYQTLMGVPPVDRGLLMCYNLGGIKNPETDNSILDPKTLKKYLSVAQYPLPLDIAFPVFQWQVWFRHGKYKGIIHNDLKLETNTAVFKSINDNQYAIRCDTIIGDNYFREGDVFRLERNTDAELLATAKMVTKHVKYYRRLTFFHWDKALIQQHEATIKQIYSSY